MSEGGQKDQARMTEEELQSQVMSFADRFVAILGPAFATYERTSPSSEKRRSVLISILYPMAAAYIIAAESDPGVALLDMVTMITLGRMISEDVGLKEFGSGVEPILKAYQKAEEDIWEIARQVLTPDEQNQLYALIQEWRQKHPETTLFSHIRFSDFAAERRRSKLARGEKVSGLFKSVEKATKEAEEVRLLAERGMFLGTRLPQLAGLFADDWASRVASNPEVKQMLTDIHTFSVVSERLAYSTDELSNQIAKQRKAAVDQIMEEVSQLREVTVDQVMKRVSIERKLAIDQLVDRVAQERKRTIEEFLAEEKRMKGLLTDLRQTLAVGNELVTSTNILAGRLGLEEGGAAGKTPSQPFNIKDYQATLVEASDVIHRADSLVKTIDHLMISPGWEQSLPRFLETLTAAEKKGEQWVTHTFLLGASLILIFFLTLLGYRYCSHRLFGSARDRGST
ncbi:MAG: hypothetical protein JSU72_17035 [Deltaproteobacteria bacterium]|nr:MAG: hypothetical protein JSU72_17035 [Deltaproteobacteria bacterium]